MTFWNRTFFQSGSKLWMNSAGEGKEMKLCCQDYFDILNIFSIELSLDKFIVLVNRVQAIGLMCRHQNET